MLPLPPVTQALLLANVGIFFLDQLLGHRLVMLFGLWPLGAGFWPWQVVTYSFLHFDFNHLFFNMLGLWMFGGELEQVWGQKRYLQFYAASVVAAALSQLLVNFLLGATAPTIGASGGLFGLMAGFAREHPHEKIVPLIPPIPMPVWVFVVLYGALELVLGVTGTANGVAHFAHLGGLLGGLLCLLLWPHRPRPAAPGP